MAIDAEGVQTLCSIRKTKDPASLPDARVELDSAMTREEQEGDRRDFGRAMGLRASAGMRLVVDIVGMSRTQGQIGNGVWT